MKRIFVLLVLGFICLTFSRCKNNSETSHKDWPVYLGDKASSHYSMLDQINKDNVDQLKVAWQYHTGDADSSGHSQIECNPIEIHGVLYGTSPRLKLFALDAATGKQKWVFDPFSGVSKEQVRINVNRGVTYWSDAAGKQARIFYVAGSDLYAVNALTGKLITDFGDQGKIDLHDGLDRKVKDLYVTATTPGIIYKDLLIMGTRVSESNPAAPGHIRAYDVHTGKRRWIFHTIPQPGEDGYETWQDKDAWKYTGGANCWAGMSLDEKRGVVYVPTGSATFDFYGGFRKGKDLFADCILALDAATGKLLWHYQTIHHDLWDRDPPASPNLVTLHHDGKKIDALAQITKTGFVFVLDRETGKPIFPVKEVPVPDTPALSGEMPWPTQPVPVLPKPFVRQHFTDSGINHLVPASAQAIIRKRLAQLGNGNMFLPPSEKGSIIFPGFDGGGEWGGAAFDPATGFLYVNANQIPWILTMVRAPAEKKLPEQTVAGHGKRVYLGHCMACHGKDRKGGGDYPSLRHIGSKYTRAQLLEIINNGRRMMPAFAQLPAQDKKSVVAYLLHLKEGKMAYQDSAGEETATHDEQPPFMPYMMTGYHKFRTEEGYPANKPPWGTLTAIDLNTGETKWQIPLGEYKALVKRGIPITGTENYGGPVVTAGGLVFIAATLDGKVRAFDKTSGKLLWEAPLPAAGYATPATYEVNGKQYLVIACGGGKLDTPSGDSYVAFALP
jgi:quinoprotein glucose dehydrogenase